MYYHLTVISSIIFLESVHGSSGPVRSVPLRSKLLGLTFNAQPRFCSNGLKPSFEDDVTKRWLRWMIELFQVIDMLNIKGLDTFSICQVELHPGYGEVIPARTCISVTALLESQNIHPGKSVCIHIISKNHGSRLSYEPVNVSRNLVVYRD
jgi:hypothetical protein